MEFRYIRAIKSFCDDFEVVRKILIDIEARLVGHKDQTDYIFNIPQAPSKRLRLRYEDQKPHIIYYYDRKPAQEQDVTWQAWEVNDLTFKEVFEAVLSIKTVVHKHREVWHKNNIIFNLDSVAGVGNIFEIEFDLDRGDYDGTQLVYYSNLFQPYLGAAISGSNEDIIDQKLKEDQHDKLSLLVAATHPPD